MASMYYDKKTKRWRVRIGLFDPNKLKKKLPYIKNEYIHMLKQEITTDEIETVRNNNSSYRRPVTYEDLDACAGWIYFSLTNNKYLEMKKFSMKEFTVPAASFHKWYNKLNDKGIFSCRCNDGKSNVNGGVKLYHLAEQKRTTQSLYSRDRLGCQI